MFTHTRLTCNILDCVWFRMEHASPRVWKSAHAEADLRQCRCAHSCRTAICDQIRSTVSQYECEIILPHVIESRMGVRSYMNFPNNTSLACAWPVLTILCGRRSILRSHITCQINNPTRLFRYGIVEYVCFGSSSLSMLSDSCAHCYTMVVSITMDIILVKRIVILAGQLGCRQKGSKG